MTDEPARYRARFLPMAHADTLLDALRQEVCWQRETLTLYGRDVAVPRLLAWYGEPGLNYRYSGGDHRCEGWHPAVAALRQRIESDLGLRFNFALVNRYRDGRDYMGWHSDDERGLGRWVASVSVGATRRFLVRPPGATRSRPLDLEHGSLLVLDGRVRHSLPRSRRPVGERINLTFRWVESCGPG